MEGNIRALRSFFTRSTTSNNIHKRETANIKGHDFLRPDTKHSVGTNEISAFIGGLCKSMRFDAAFGVGTRLVIPRSDLTSHYNSSKLSFLHIPAGILTVTGQITRGQFAKLIIHPRIIRPRTYHP